MIASEETTIQQALENERWTVRRQALLKKLWKLQRSRAAREKTVAVERSTASARPAKAAAKSKQAAAQA